MTADGAAPAVDAYLAAVDKIRDTARWLILAFAAVGAAIAGTAPLSNIGKLQTSDSRFWVAIAAAVATLVAIAVAIWVAIRVFTPEAIGLDDLVQDKQLRAIFASYYEMLGGHGRNLDEFKRELDAAREAQEKAAAKHRKEPHNAHAAAEERAATKELDVYTPTVALIMHVGHYVHAERRFTTARRWMFACALAGGVSIVFFAWAANPPDKPAAAPAPKSTPG